MMNIQNLDSQEGAVVENIDSIYATFHLKFWFESN